MLEYFRKKLETLVDDLLSPFWNSLSGWLKSLSWFARVLLVVCLVFAYIVFLNWETIPTLAVSAVRLIRVINEPTQIPIDRPLAGTLQETASRISDGLQKDLDKPLGIDPQSGWTFAQVLAATIKPSGFNPQAAQIYLRSVADPTCACWRETPLSQSPPHVAASGWALFALAEIGVPASEAELRFFLNEQQSGGWWSLFPSRGNDKYASTFATAWALLGLQNQLSRKLINGPASAEVSQAIAAGAAWLLARRGSHARWENYPVWQEEGAESDSISGLAIHTLHLSAPDAIAQIDVEWLQALPAVPPTALETEKTFLWVQNTRTHDEREIDHSVHIKLPWMLIATVDAYRRGDSIERARALGWIEQTIRQESVMNADTAIDPWMRAEMLIAIRYLLSNIASHR